MKKTTLSNENGQGFIRAFTSNKVEKINPIEYYKTAELEQSKIIIKDLLSIVNCFLPTFLDDAYLEKKAYEMIVGFCEKCEKTEIHQNFIELLNTTRKKDQIKLLKGMTLNIAELMSLIFKSYSEFGYLYSKYHFKNLPNGFEEKILPKFFNLDENKQIVKIGNTDLSNGELKHIIENRKVMISHFIEKQDVWHCFFSTYKSLEGKENWKDGQPHFHYISNGFGISKDDFIESMRVGNYKSTSIHIDLIEYGKNIK